MIYPNTGHGRIMKGFTSFKNKIREQGLTIVAGPFAALVFRAYCAGWHDRKVADTTEVRISAVDTPQGHDPLSLTEAHSTWDVKQDFTQFNRRQTSKIGFFAGWHSRKLAEFKLALGLPGNYASFRRAWSDNTHRERRNMDATRAALEGQNWFIDSTGRTWVDARDEIADQWASGELKTSDAVSVAMEFIAQKFSQTSAALPIRVIWKDAADIGIGRMTLNRAAERLGVQPRKFSDEWFWTLPKAEEFFEPLLDAGIPTG